MKLTIATRIAEYLEQRFSPFCERIEIAGSIRRGASEVKDIELVVIAKWETQVVATGLFEEEVRVNLLHQEFERGVYSLVPGKQDDIVLRWIKPGVQAIQPWHIHKAGKYWRGLNERGAACKVDVFLTTPERWGTILAIRTGSADFSHALASRALRVRHKVSGGGLYRVVDGEHTFVPTYEEADFFHALGLEVTPPQVRFDQQNFRKLKGGGAS